MPRSQPMTDAEVHPLPHHLKRSMEKLGQKAYYRSPTEVSIGNRQLGYCTYVYSGNGWVMTEKSNGEAPSS
ncbi:MAG: hypothetical protein VXW22_11740 [Pseudomonadota bacterium]|nr:hypothetical protein [Pseudomonadota bacterium]